MKADTSTRVLLVGNEHLGEGDRIGFAVANRGDSRQLALAEPSGPCTPMLNITFSVDLLERSGNLTLAQSIIRLPPAGGGDASKSSMLSMARLAAHVQRSSAEASTNYFLCVKSEGATEYLYQADLTFEGLTSLKVFTDLLPVWLQVLFSMFGLTMSFYSRFI